MPTNRQQEKRRGPYERPEPAQCEACNGTGDMNWRKRTYREMMFNEACPKCGGSGIAPANPPHH